VALVDKLVFSQENQLKFVVQHAKYRSFLTTISFEEKFLLMSLLKQSVVQDS